MDDAKRAAAEARRQKILARGRDRLATITGTAPTAARGGAWRSHQAPRCDPVPPQPNHHMPPLPCSTERDQAWCPGRGGSGTRSTGAGPAGRACTARSASSRARPSSGPRGGGPSGSGRAGACHPGAASQRRSGAARCMAGRRVCGPAQGVAVGFFPFGGLLGGAPAQGRDLGHRRPLDILRARRGATQAMHSGGALTARHAGGGALGGCRRHRAPPPAGGRPAGGADSSGGTGTWRGGGQPWPDGGTGAAAAAWRLGLGGAGSSVAAATAAPAAGGQPGGAGCQHHRSGLPPAARHARTCTRQGRWHAVHGRARRLCGARAGLQC